MSTVRVTPRASWADPAEPGLAGTLGALAAGLDRVGYGEFLASFSDLSRGREIFCAVRQCLAGPLKVVAELFLLNEVVRIEDLPPQIQLCIDDLAAAGVLTLPTADSAQSPELVVRRVGGLWYICQPPQPNPLHYVGEDSLALFDRLPIRSVRRSLDVCAGPGLHTLRAATFSESVTAVELDPEVADLARLNVLLNGIQDRVEVLDGDLCAPLGKQRFDLIIANPPSLPYPPELPAPRVGHGGTDGRLHISKILTSIPDILEDRGSAHLVGMTTTDGTTAEVCEWLRLEARRGGMDILCTFLAQVSLRGEDRYFRSLTSSVAAIAKCDKMNVSRSYAALLDGSGTDHLAAFSLRVVPGSGHLECLDLSQAREAGMWHV